MSIGRTRKGSITLILQAGLTPEANKRLGSLSKATGKGLDLAAALLHDPGGFDPRRTNPVWTPINIVGNVKKIDSEIGKEKTILLSTHVMKEVDSSAIEFDPIN